MARRSPLCTVLGPVLSPSGAGRALFTWEFQLLLPGNSTTVSSQPLLFVSAFSSQRSACWTDVFGGGKFCPFQQQIRQSRVKVKFYQNCVGKLGMAARAVVQAIPEAKAGGLLEISPRPTWATQGDSLFKSTACEHQYKKRWESSS